MKLNRYKSDGNNNKKEGKKKKTSTENPFVYRYNNAYSPNTPLLRPRKYNTYGPVMGHKIE